MSDWAIVSQDEYERLRARRSLDKRAFTISQRWNKARISAYLAGQWLNPPYDDTFTWNTGLVTGVNEGTVSEQAQFSTIGQSFQWVSAGLHGCTVLAVISNRGAYMASCILCSVKVILTDRVETGTLLGDLYNYG